MKCLPFTHDYKVVRTSQALTFTYVSFVCQKCDKPKTKQIDGHYEVEDFKAFKAGELPK